MFLPFGPVVVEIAWTIIVLFGHHGIVHHRRHIRFSVYNVPILPQSTYIAHPALVEPISHFATVQVYSTLASIVSTLIVQSVYDWISLWGLFVVMGHHFRLFIVVSNLKNFLLLFQLLDIFFQLFDEFYILFFPIIVIFLDFLQLLELIGIVVVGCWG